MGVEFDNWEAVAIRKIVRSLLLSITWEVTYHSTLELKLYIFSSVSPNMLSNPSLPMHLGLLLMGVKFDN